MGRLSSESAKTGKFVLQKTDLGARYGDEAVTVGKKLYHVTSKDAAKEVIKTQVLKGSKWEAGNVFAFTKRPTLKQAKLSGARAAETVVEFDRPPGFVTDFGVVDKLQTIAVKKPGPIDITGATEVEFRRW